MSYHFFTYVLLFLPIAMLVYQVTPKKYRFATLLTIDYTFFFLISKGLIIYLLASTLVCYYFSLKLESVENGEFATSKEKEKKKKQILTLAVLIFLCVLFVLKYFNFFAGGVVDIISQFKPDITFTPIAFLVPIGISYYTLQIISYLTDISRGKRSADKNLAKLALYLSFFPQIIEGPISRFDEVADDLYAGRDLTYHNITRGYQRIVWGMFKKYLIADRVSILVGAVFGDYEDYSGFIVLIAAILYTLQLYMDFSGCIDIAIGSGEIFGVKMPENFRQPFFAKNASDFWHRWHITLGTWFKDYIFFPVSMSPKVKKLGKTIKKKRGKYLANIVTSMIALFCVWLSNGLWHGPKSTYIFYGFYYFVIISMEVILEEPSKKLYNLLKLKDDGVVLKVFRFVKLCCIVVVGELFFRADSVKIGFVMLERIVNDFQCNDFKKLFIKLGMDKGDWLLVAFALILVIVVGCLKEFGVDIRDSIAKTPTPVRWLIWYALLFAIVIGGAYGPGYSKVAMMYAGF